MSLCAPEFVIWMSDFLAASYGVSLEKEHLSEDQHCRLDMSSKLVSSYNFKDKGLCNFRGMTHDIIDCDLKALCIMHLYIILKIAIKLLCQIDLPLNNKPPPTKKAT